jgi:hypothetical protein
LHALQYSQHGGGGGGIACEFPSSGSVTRTSAKRDEPVNTGLFLLGSKWRQKWEKGKEIVALKGSLKPITLQEPGT